MNYGIDRVCKFTLLSAVFVMASAVSAGDLRTSAELYGDHLTAGVDIPAEFIPSVDLVRVAVEDIEREQAGLPYRFAIPNEVRMDPRTVGIWEEPSEGLLVWRMRLVSPGAASLNLGFDRYSMPQEGRMAIYSTSDMSGTRWFTAIDNADHGQLWTPVILSDDITVEVTIDADALDELELSLASVNVGYRGFGKEGQNDSGWCNIDVVCPEGDAWRDEIPSVAVISIGGSLNCTGFMVNNTARDQKPLFMTARHCGLTSTNASTLVAYWNYETSKCGGTPDGSLNQYNSGSYWRASYSPSDFTLVELDSDPDPSYGVTFSGWDRSGTDATYAVAIHHPSVDEKRISFENDPTMTTSYLGYSAPGDGTHVRVIDWDQGTTEGGSSGSPLYDQNHHVIGQLHGGYAACGNDSSDWYGKLSVSWEGGGTSSTRLKDWLDPGNTGDTSVNTLVPGAGCTGNQDCDDGLFCNGAETCDTGTCMAGDDPCPGQECDEENDVCISPDCNSNGICESGEDCNGCPGDCISGTAGAVCGNTVCETGFGEDCVSCPQDCNGRTGGKPSRRFCCGDGDGPNPVGCTDARCHTDGNTCSTYAAGTDYCCGDGICEGDENGGNCEVDCGSGTPCGDGFCDGVSGEDQCTCAADCGTPPGSEVPGSTCNDGLDNDCDGSADDADGDCLSCAATGESCVTDADCCSYKCLGAAGKKVCK